MRILFAVLVLAGTISAAKADDEAFMLTFIPKDCCITNHCCWEITESEVRSLPDDNWEVRSTGQIVKRRNWSPDGRFYRCACDYDNDQRKYIRHQGSKTRCLFVPMRMGLTWPPTTSTHR